MHWRIASFMQRLLQLLLAHRRAEFYCVAFDHSFVILLRMPITLNLTDVLKLFRERGVTDRTQIADYLQAIADDAAQLSKLWTDCFRSSPKPFGNPQFSARQFSGRLSFQYSSASSVLRGRLTEEQSRDLFNALGALLKTRNELRAAFDQSRVTGTVDDFAIESQLEALHDAAGLLGGLAEAVRAQR
jgi:hypothetical protein